MAFPHPDGRLEPPLGTTKNLLHPSAFHDLYESKAQYLFTEGPQQKLNTTKNTLEETSVGRESDRVLSKVL